MKKLAYLVPATLCVALTLPVQGNKTSSARPDDPDTIVTDAPMVDESDNYTENSDWAGTDDTTDAFDTDSVLTDSAEANPEDFCAYNDDLLISYDTKNADYNQTNSKAPDTGVSFSATLFIPSAEKNGEIRNDNAYTLLASNVLKAMTDSVTQSKWKIDNIDKMFENKWKALRNGYNDDINILRKEMGAEMRYPTYSFRTTITPVWNLQDSVQTTYSIEDESYTGGAHGMNFHYYLTIDQQNNRIMGLTDIFKADSLDAVFKLVGEKLKTGPQAANDEETWPSVAEIIPAPAANDYSVVAGQFEQYNGKWYPRPAMTECGIVFTYPPYVKNCYAAGTINVLINYYEAKEWLR